MSQALTYRRLITKLYRQTNTIKVVSSKLEELQFPNQTPLIFSRLISKVAEKVEIWAIKSLRQITNPVAADLKKIKFLIHAMEIISGDLRYTERAVTRNTPWSIIRPFEQLAERIYSDSLFIVRPQWSWNYSMLERAVSYKNAFGDYLSTDDFNKLLHKVDQAENANPKKYERLFIVGFPNIERMNVLLHASFGHELGHPISVEYFDKEKPPITALYNKVQAIRPGQQDLFKQFKNLKKVLRIRQRALEELISDYVGLQIFGPAALYAIDEICVNNDLDKIPESSSNYYPPWRFRIRMMVNALTPGWINRFISDGKFLPSTEKIVKQKMSDLRKIAAAQNDIMQIRGDIYTKIAYESVKATLPKVKRFVRTRLKSVGITLDDLIGDANKNMIDRLFNFIPPDSSMINSNDEQINTFRGILNVGWIVYLKRYALLPYRGGTSQIRDQYMENLFAINRLVLKAIEYADLAEVWRDRNIAKGK